MFYILLQAYNVILQLFAAFQMIHAVVLTVQKGQKCNVSMLFLLSDIQNMFKNVCVCVINTCKSSQEKKLLCSRWK